MRAALIAAAIGAAALPVWAETAPEPPLWAYLADCGAVVAAAALPGGARTESGRHSLGQTMAGALWGWAIACLPLAGLRRAGRWMRKLRGRHV